MLSSMRFLIWSLALLGLLWAFGYGAFVTRVLALEPEQPAAQTDAIIVLTGGDERIETGFDLFAQKLAPKLFISGVHSGVRLEDLAREWNGLEAPDGQTNKNLPACCMDIGQKALTTIENAEETKEWMEREKVQSIRLVTSPYHMPRAMLEFHSAMPEVSIIPHVVTADTLGPQDQFFWMITFIEYHKWLVRALQLRAFL